MSEKIWFRSHVERCLQDIWEVGVTPDEDGDYIIIGGTAAGFVGIDEGSPTLVKVSVWAAIEVPMSAKLAREINDVNASLRSGRLVWECGRLSVQDSILAEAVSRESLGYALSVSFQVANDVGPTLAAVFGGHPPIEATVVEDEAET